MTPFPSSGGYPDAPGHRGVDTSIAAADAITGVAGRLRSIVYRTICEAGPNGITTDEIAKALGMPRYRVQPRTTELKHHQRIKDSGRRRYNVSGCRATVWIVADRQESQP